MENPIITHSRGNPFRLPCTFVLRGVRTPLDGWTVSSQLRNRDGGLIAELEFAVDPLNDDSSNVGDYTLSWADTNGWPDKLLGDIRYSHETEGTFNTSPPFVIEIDTPITKEDSGG